MLLSEILKNNVVAYPYRIVNEQEISYLALAGTQIDEPLCTFLDTAKYAGGIGDNIKMLLTTEDLYPLFKDKTIGLCISENPRDMFFRLHNYLCAHGEYGYTRPEFDTVIGENCNIHPLASIAKKNVRIGNNVTIEEFCVVRENTVIGDNTVIRAGTIIGGIGFEMKHEEGYKTYRVEHAGGVIIGHDVELQQTNCVDRAVYPWDNTVIGEYTRTDNMIHIAHAMKIGRGVMIAAGATFGGRTVLGDGVWIGVGATVINGITVGEKARVNIGSVATRSVPDGGSVTGNFAIEHGKFIENLKKSLE